MRALQVLHGPAKDHLQEPEKLKFLLAPVLIKNPADQVRFYDIFDRFFEEISQPLPRPEKPSIWEKWGVAAVLILLGVAVVISSLAVLNRINQPSVQLIKPPYRPLTLGDTLVLEADPQRWNPKKHQLQWDLIDVPTNATVRSLTDSMRWALVFDSLAGSPTKAVVLRILHRKQQKELAGISITVTIHCPDPPQVKALQFDPVVDVGASVAFSAVVEGEGPFAYAWDLAEGQVGEDSVATGVYPRAGVYSIGLTVRRPSEKGVCEASSQSTLQVGALAAPPPYKGLEKEEVAFTAVFTGWYWLLLGVAGLFPLFFLLKWLRKPKEKPEQDPAALPGQSPDKPPYFIPFRDQHGRIQVEQEQFLLANAMRIRQEGLRKEVDVPTSIRQTIDRGGFPFLEFRYTTQPTEYLALVDELSPQSHQARLFRYFTEMLREQDVLLETFFYQTDLNRLWNDQFPKGISLEVLQRQYPHRRLVIMGDGRGLIDPRAGGKQVLRLPLIQTLKRWPYRLLLTPSPPRSWGYEEAALHQHLVLFPADLRGLADAAVFLESGQIDEEIEETPFALWQQRHEKVRQDPEAEFRNWRKLDEHRDYLKNHPEVFTWLCALAVYPNPTWELTIAIGEALKPLGVEVTLDNLLLLARIPWLQKGRLHPGLRREMLETLDDEAEYLAREAVIRELDAVSTEVRESSVAAEWESNLAIQQFASAPYDGEIMEKLRALMDKGLLGKKQLEEINHALNLKVARKMRMTKGGSSNWEPERIQDLLQAKEPEKEEKPPLPTPGFWRFAISTLLFLVLLAGSLALDRSPWLHRLAFNGADQQASSTLLVKEVFQVEEAVLLNNEAVDLFYQAIQEKKESPKETAYQLPPEMEDAEAILNRAMQLDPEFPLAGNNLARLNYNMGVHLLSHILKFGRVDSLLEENANIRFGAFEGSMGPPAAVDGIHGRGLVAYYQGHFSIADTLLGQCVALAGQTYFDTLSYRPHLRDLLDSNVPVPVPDDALSQETDARVQNTTVVPPDRRAPVSLSLEGQVIDARSGMPVSGAQLTLLKADARKLGAASAEDLKERFADMFAANTLWSGRTNTRGYFNSPLTQVPTREPLTLKIDADNYQVELIAVSDLLSVKPKQTLNLQQIRLNPQPEQSLPPDDRERIPSRPVQMELSVYEAFTGNPLPGVTLQVFQDGKNISSYPNNSSHTFQVEGQVGDAFTLELSKPGYVSRTIPIDIPQGFSDIPPIELVRELADFSLYFDVFKKPTGTASYSDLYEQYASEKKRIVRLIEKTIPPKAPAAQQAVSAFGAIEQGYRDLQDAAGYIRQVLRDGCQVEVAVTTIVPNKEFRDPSLNLLVDARGNSVIRYFNEFDKGALADFVKRGRLTFRKDRSEAEIKPDYRELDDYDLNSLFERRVDLSFRIRYPDDKGKAAAD